MTFNVNCYVGIEDELGSMIATSSDLQFGDLNHDTKSPNMLSYSANVVVSPWRSHAIAPYGTGGVGGLTMFERLQVGVTGGEMFLSGNGGGGAKWYTPTNRWGLRGDYRFAAMKSKDDAPAFFGRDRNRFKQGVDSCLLTHLAIGGDEPDASRTATRCDCVSCRIENRLNMRISVPTARRQ